MVTLQPVCAVPLDWSVPRATAVVRVRRETPDTWTLYLRPPDGVFAFEPGQFNMLYAFGVGEVPISISGDPSQADLVVHTVRAVGAVTTALARLRAGQGLGLRGPFGTGWPIQEAEGKDVLVVAGGIGLAPLRPLVYLLLRQRQRYGRVAILYGARTPQDVLYRADLQRWRARLDVRVEVTVDRAGRDWRGWVGVVTRLIPRAGIEPGETVAFLCGPEVMMRFAVRELDTLGVPRQATFLSVERNMMCAVGLCGHCQFGGSFVCRQGPVFRYSDIEDRFRVREL
ncbi:MAG: FAD/NAD(P)-binding protein [Armatimonadota bacterium]|nr:FAD/NAD(P)-binding protein [Armatimonadota bacterium]